MAFFRTALTRNSSQTLSVHFTMRNMSPTVERHRCPMGSGEWTKRGNPRKSRLARLPTSFMAGSFEFEPTEDDWQRIETAYPFLLLADRDEISRIATDYLMHAPFESYTPKAADGWSGLM